MKMLGEKTEQAYKELFGCNCPRPKNGIFTECLIEKFPQLIEEITNMVIHNEEGRPIWLNQFIKGRNGNREFCQGIVDHYLSNIEKEVKKRLRKTKEGILFYEKGKDYAIKMLTFCVLSQKLMKERAKSKKTLSEIKTLLINFTLVYYYLLNDDSVCNASIQQFEEVIERKQRKNTSQEISETIEEPLVVGEDEPVESEIVLDQLPKIEIDFKMVELNKSRKPSFLTPKKVEILTKATPFEIVKKEEVSEEKHKSQKAFDLANLQKEDIDYLKKFEEECKKCTKSIPECSDLREKANKIVKEDTERLYEEWETNHVLRPCLALEILEERTS